LAYAETHPARVLSLVLRGIFLLRASEITWFYQEGASAIFPDLWEDYLAPIPLAERGDMVGAYYRRLTDPDPEVQLTAARAWSTWEGATSRLLIDENTRKRFGSNNFALAFARIECHYFINRGFLATDNYLLEQIDRIRHLPGVIVQGRYDIICPARSAWDLHRAWPEADLNMVPDAGHSAYEPGIIHHLVEATDRMVNC